MTEASGGWRIVGNMRDPAVSRQFPALDRLYGEGAGARLAEAPGMGLRREAIPFGVGDEIEAGVSAGVDYLGGLVTGRRAPLGDLYSERLAIARGDQARTREAMPILSGAANVAGALVTGPGSMLTGATTAAGRVGGAAAVGAAQGGAYGFGEGQGGLGPRVDAALGGAAIGGVAGGAVGGFAELVGRLARGVSYVKGLKGDGAAARAQQMVIDALKADGIDAATLATRAKAGKPLTIADLGENTRALLGSASRQGGEARATATRFLEDRSRGQFGRLVGDVSDATGTNPAALGATVDATRGRRAAAATTGYARAYAEAPPALSKNAQTILETPAGRRAVATATEMLANSRRPMTDASGRYTVEALDFIQRAMADQIGEAKVGLAGTRAGNITSLREQFIEELPDSLRAVMRNYATESALLDATAAGRKFLTADADEMAAGLAKKSGPEQEAFRLGAARALLDQMAGKNITADASAIFQNPRMGERLSRVFGSKRLFQEFMERAQAERVMQETRNAVLKGSPTAGRIADDAAMSGGVLGDAAQDVLTGSSLTTTGLRAAINAATGAKSRLLDGVNQGVARNIADLATNPDLGAVSGALGRTAPQLPAVVSTPLGRGALTAAPRLGGAAGQQAQQPPAGATPPPPGVDGWRIIRDGQPQAAPMSGQPLPQRVGRLTEASAAGNRPVAPITLARAFVGQDERRNARTLSAFFERFGGSRIDPATTAWCAAFVNGVLGAAGMKGTGRLNARSFLDLGQPTDAPEVGDIAVFTRGDPNGWQGHVGFYAGRVTRDGREMIRVVGGNQDDGVSEKLYPADRLLGFRRVTPETATRAA